MNDKPDGVTIPEQRWLLPWYERRPDRLAKEEQMMKNRFPQFSLKRHDGQLFWEGTLKSNSYKRYRAIIFYPNDFPYDAPKPYIVDPDLTEKDPPPPHMYKDGRLCVFEHRDGTWQSNSTAATMVGLVSPWIHAYEHWLETGNWPGPEAD